MGDMLHPNYNRKYIFNKHEEGFAILLSWQRLKDKQVNKSSIRKATMSHNLTDSPNKLII